MRLFLCYKRMYMARLKEETLNLILNVKGDKARKEINDTEKAIADSKTRVAEYRKEMRLLAQQGQTNSARYKELSASIKEENASITQNKKKLEELRSGLKLNDMTMQELSQRIKTLKREMDLLRPDSKEWKALNRELQATSARMQQLKGNTDAAAAAISKAQAVLGVVTAVVYGVARVFGGAFNTLKDFEQANVNLATILGKSTSEIAILTSEAERLGRTTKYTASEVTGLQIELAKLGFNQGQILTMEESVLHFATAVGAELPEAAALAGATLRMFGLSTRDTEDTLATLALATNKSALSFSFFQNALSTVGPVANTFGFSVKDTTALLGALANAGFDASSAATATRNIILNLADANGKLAQALGEPVQTFDDLIAGLQTLDDKGIDLAATLELTDKRSVAAFNTFLHGTEATAALRAELEETDGVLKQIAEQRANTLAGAIDKLSSAWQGFILKLKASTGFLKQAVEYLTQIVTWITPGSRHDADVENTVDNITAGYGTAEGRAYVADQKVKDLQAQLDRLDEDLEKANNRRSRRRIEKEKKRIEKELSVYQDAYSRLQSAADALTDDSGSGGGSSGNDSGSGSDSSGDGGKGKNIWSLQSDESYLAARAELTRQFNEGQIESQEKYEEQLYQLEVSSLQARLALHKEKGAERLKIERQIQDMTMAHNAKVQKQNEDQAKKEAEEKKKIQDLEKSYLTAFIATVDNHEEKANAQEKAENIRFKEELELYRQKKDGLSNYQQIVETLERQHQNNLRKIRLDAIEAEQKDLETQHKINLAAIQEKYAYELKSAQTPSRKKAELTRENVYSTASENVAYLQAQAQQLQRIVSSGTVDGMLDGQKLSQKELDGFRLKLFEILKSLKEAEVQLDELERKGFGETLKSILSGTGDGVLFGVKQSDWDTFFLNIKNGTLNAKDLQTAITGIGGAAQEEFKLANQAIQLTNAKEKKALDDYKKGQDSRKESLEDRYKAGLMTESQYNDEVEQMEADMQAKQEEMELEQAQRTKTMSIVESIINTALGVTKTLAQWGVPAGIAPAAIMTAMGAAQTAMIAAQPVGYAEGGEIQVQRAQDGRSFRAKVDPTRRGYVDQPTVLVGEEGPEYVISAEALKNPDIRAYADTIEQARKTGRLRSLRMEAVRPAQPVVGRADGGFTQDGTPSGAIGISPTVMQDLTRLSETVDRLSAILEDGIEAEVVMTGRKGLVRRFEEYNRMKSRGQL